MKETRIKFYKVVVVPILFYSNDTWVLTNRIVVH
jgi:hypothetical protein